ncbi:hypothetical protein AURDEDRAFT_129955 [Auricularia subglabra TFB-10046 SS5]|nr:hypothetical protein AURDEDRAFT_129955 [Auricularia subglabra TFB-10046 SS5]
MASVFALVPLPDEMLREIFLQTLGTPPTALLGDIDAQWKERRTLEDNAFRATLPFQLATVSRRWRRVALNTGELWAWISLGAHPHGKLILRPEYLREMLLRSKNARLDIFIDVYPSIRDAWLASAHAVCAAVIGAAARWRFLCVNIPPGSTTASVAALLACKAPVLEGLVVGDGGPCNRWFHRERWMPDLPQTDVALLALSSPKMRHIELANLILDAWLIDPPPTLSALVYLSLDTVRLRRDALWHLLSSAGNLETLCLATIDSADDGAWNPAPASRLRLARLTQLELCGCGEPNVLSQWAAHLDLPHLAYLDVRDLTDRDLLALAPCVRASLWKLWYAQDEERRGLAPVFAAFPCVREFSIGPCGSVPDPALLQAMADGAVFPELERLLFYGAELVWHAPDADHYEHDWVLEHADEARAAARALLELARARNSPERRAASLAPRPPRRLQHIRFDESKVDGQFFGELQELVDVN